MNDKALPESFSGWEVLARSNLDDERYRYVASTAGEGETARANLEAFRRWKIVNRTLRDVGQRSTATTVLGTPCSAPLVLAPVRALGYIRRDGDLSVSRVAAELGVPLAVSTFATVPIEKTAEVMGKSPRWFQLYPGKDPEIMKSLVKRAESAGYSAIILTVDKPANYPHLDGPRTHDFERHGYEVYFSDPVFRARFGGAPERQFEAAFKLWKDIRLAPGLPLQDLHAVTGWSRLPVVVKGILSPKDAEAAADQGASGVVVSNHGGRSLDGEVASLDALLEVKKVTKPGFALILDSGVRSGADIVKALALGADAAMIGKAYALALGAYGEEGVRRAVGGLIQEFDAAMAICGALNPGEIERDMVTGV